MWAIEWAGDKTVWEQAEKEAGKLQLQCYRIIKRVGFCATLEEDESEKYAMQEKELLGSIIILIH